MDPFGLLPPAIRANAEREEMADRHLMQAQAVAKALKLEDPRLELVWVGDRAKPIGGLQPGRFHIRRRNDPPSPDSYMPITGPKGEYREPDFGVLEELRKRDIWKHGLPEAKEEEPKDNSGDLKDELLYELSAAKRVAGDGGLDKRKWGRG